MKHFVKIIVFTIVILTTSCASKEQQAKDMLNRFYQTHQSIRPAGALELNELIAFRQFLSIPLFNLLKDVSVAEETHLAQTSSKTPPLVNSDLFTSHPKGASAFRILACETQDTGSICTVELTYQNAKLPKPTIWNDRIILGMDARGWVIDDIEYGGGPDMQHGSLKKTLQMILDSNKHSMQ